MRLSGFESAELTVVAHRANIAFDARATHASPHEVSLVRKNNWAQFHPRTARQA